MIVTTDASAKVGRVVLQKSHTSLAHQIARAFGNSDFASPDPREPMEFVVLHHDRGWDTIDPDMPQDPATGFPYSLDKTPVDLLLSTTTKSLEFNKEHHPYCGLLAGMHIWGLYHGRFGISDHIVIETLSGEARVKTEKVLAGIKRRYEELRIMLEGDRIFGEYVEPEKLMQNYRLLQFCDRLSLYFNFNAGRDGEGVTFTHVPVAPGHVQVVNVLPLGSKQYSLYPYPFHDAKVELELQSYPVPAAKPGATTAPAVALAKAPEVERITLVPAGPRGPVQH